MNSDTVELAAHLAKDTGAILSCPVCGHYDLHAYDDDAERMTYARATEAWKDGARGFRLMKREDVMQLVKSVLDDALAKCPSCHVD